jgi:Fic family protein
MPDTDISADRSILDRIDRKKKELDSRRPLPKGALIRLSEEFRLEHTYHSNAIEGNTLTLQETRLVLEQGITAGGKTLAEHLEATNNAQAFTRVEQLAQERRALDHVTVHEIHELVTRGILFDPGRYRTQNVRILGAKKRPPDFSKIPGLMDDCFQTIADMRGHRVIAVAYLHHRLVEIHPFTDGNGRVARLLMNLHLMRCGYPPVVLKKEDRKRYFDCLRRADGGELAPFTNFIARALDGSLIIYLSVFGGEDELIPLSELTVGSSYSQEYLSLRARQGVLNAVKIGRVWHSTSRALREYREEYGK